MTSENEVLLVADAPATDEPAKQPAFSVIPEKLPEHTEALGQAVLELMTPVEPGEAAKVFGRRIDRVVQSLGQISQDASSSAQSINHAAEEVFRRHFELGMHFLEDLVMARHPAEVLRLQLNFVSAQFELFAEQTREMQSHFARTFFAPAAKGGPQNK